MPAERGPSGTGHDTAVARYPYPTERAIQVPEAPESNVESAAKRRAAYAALAALLAVGERDKARIEWLEDRAVCSGCGSDVGESGVCTYSACDDGEMIPASDLPVALREKCDSIQEDRAEWRSDWEALRAEAKELERAGERDRQQIARLTEALAEKERHAWMIAAKCIRDLEFDLAEFYRGRAEAFREIRAVLADEEDAGATKSSEADSEPIPGEIGSTKPCQDSCKRRHGSTEGKPDSGSHDWTRATAAMMAGWTDWLALALALAFTAGAVLLAWRSCGDDLEAAQHEAELDELWGPDEEWVEP